MPALFTEPAHFRSWLDAETFCRASGLADEIAAARTRDGLRPRLEPSRRYACCGSRYEARARSFQPPSCFYQTCMTPILVSVTLPSSSVCQTQRCRTIAVLPTTCTVISGNSSDLTVAYRPMTPSMNFALSSSRASEWL